MKYSRKFGSIVVSFRCLSIFKMHRYGNTCVEQNSELRYISKSSNIVRLKPEATIFIRSLWYGNYVKAAIRNYSHFLRSLLCHPGRTSLAFRLAARRMGSVCCLSLCTTVSCSSGRKVPICAGKEAIHTGSQMVESHPTRSLG